MATLVLGLALEHWRPHERLRPAWRTNLGLWVVGTLVTTVVCGACGWVVAAWAAGVDRRRRVASRNRGHPRTRCRLLPLAPSQPPAPPPLAVPPRSSRRRE